MIHFLFSLLVQYVGEKNGRMGPALLGGLFQPFVAKVIPDLWHLDDEERKRKKNMERKDN